MIYEEYEAIWSKIRKLEKKLFDLINKRDEIFDKTQPESSSFDKEKVDGNNPKDMMVEYVIDTEYLDEKIRQLNQTLDDRYQILRRKREELKLSKHIDDRIYTLRYIERLSVFKIASIVGYERTQVYRKLKKIEKKTNMQQNAT